jgi:hypothetical protein
MTSWHPTLTKPIRESIFVKVGPPFSTILMGTLLEQPSFVFFSFFLFVAPSPSFCIAQEKKKKKGTSFL